MTFFTQLSSLELDSINFAIKKDKLGNLTVVLMCSHGTSDIAVSLLAPLSLTNSPEKLDEEFFNIISNPVRKTQELITNVKTYEAKLAEASKNTNEAKATTEKIKKYTDKVKVIESAAGFGVKAEKEKLLELIQKILTIEPNNKYAIEKKGEIIKKTSESTLFELE